MKMIKRKKNIENVFIIKLYIVIFLEGAKFP